MPSNISNQMLLFFKVMFWLNVATAVGTILGMFGASDKCACIGSLGTCITCLANTACFVLLIWGSVVAGVPVAGSAPVS